MGPRRDNKASATSKRQDRQIRQNEKKTRDKKQYLKDDENAGAFNTQLRAFNLQLRDIAGDGNCLFRSFSDQMDGNQTRHGYYREKICEFMRANRPDFEPFIVDQPFDTFIRSLSKDGTFGGNECLVAFSRLYDTKICIHQLNQPVWAVCFSDSPKHEIHISYHNYEHYSSVRKLGDNTAESANVRPSMTTCNPSTINEKAKKSTTTTTNEDNYGACAASSTDLFTEHDVDYVHSQLTNSVDRQLIRDSLNDNGGDVDGTISYLLTLDIQSSSPVPVEESNNSIERIMSITGVYDVDLVQHSFAHNNLDVDSTVTALLTLGIGDNENNQQASNEDNQEVVSDEDKPATKKRPVPSRQIKTDKKKAKKQRATEKHRAQLLATSGTPKKSEEKCEPPVNNEQEPIIPANMEFIRI